MRYLIFMDFDGVICDSLDECLVSSWKAYYHLFLQSAPAQVNVSLKAEFSRLRPFVRNGEDYVLIQKIIHSKIPINCQEDFDACKNSRDLKHFKELIYSARSRYLETDREYWLKLNRLYPHIKENLPVWTSSPFFYILSTRRSEYIVEILKHNKVKMPPKRILYTHGREKHTIIAGLLEKKKDCNAVLIDDQIDHLLVRRDPRIEVYLADWGYIKEEWLEESCRIKIMDSLSLASWLEAKIRLKEDRHDIPVV